MAFPWDENECQKEKFGKKIDSMNKKATRDNRRPIYKVDDLRHHSRVFIYMEKMNWMKQKRNAT